MTLEEGDLVPGTQVQLGATTSAMPARVSASAVRYKTQRLHARIKMFKMQEERTRETMAVAP